MTEAIRTSIGTAGRLVLPKALRDAAGLTDGMPVDLRFREGRIEIVPAPLEVRVVRRGRLHVLEASEDVPTLSRDEVDVTLDSLRGGAGRG